MGGAPPKPPDDDVNTHEDETETDAMVAAPQAPLRRSVGRPPAASEVAAALVDGSSSFLDWGGRLTMRMRLQLDGEVRALYPCFHGDCACTGVFYKDFFCAKSKLVAVVAVDTRGVSAAGHAAALRAHLRANKPTLQLSYGGQLLSGCVQAARWVSAADASTPQHRSTSLTDAAPGSSLTAPTLLDDCASPASTGGAWHFTLKPTRRPKFGQLVRCVATVATPGGRRATLLSSETNHPNTVSSLPFEIRTKPSEWLSMEGLPASWTPAQVQAFLFRPAAACGGAPSSSSSAPATAVAAPPAASAPVGLSAGAAPRRARRAAANNNKRAPAGGAASAARRGVAGVKPKRVFVHLDGAVGTQYAFVQFASRVQAREVLLAFMHDIARVEAAPGTIAASAVVSMIPSMNRRLAEDRTLTFVRAPSACVRGMWALQEATATPAKAAAAAPRSVRAASASAPAGAASPTMRAGAGPPLCAPTSSASSALLEDGQPLFSIGFGWRGRSCSSSDDVSATSSRGVKRGRSEDSLASSTTATSGSGSSAYDGDSSSEDADGDVAMMATPGMPSGFLLPIMPRGHTSALVLPTLPTARPCKRARLADPTTATTATDAACILPVALGPRGSSGGSAGAGVGAGAGAGAGAGSCTAVAPVITREPTMGSLAPPALRTTSAASFMSLGGADLPTWSALDSRDQDLDLDALLNCCGTTIDQDPLFDGLLLDDGEAATPGFFAPAPATTHHTANMCGGSPTITASNPFAPTRRAIHSYSRPGFRLD